MPTLRNWAGNVAFTSETLHRPRCLEQLQQLVARTPCIRALGTGHSFNRIADTTGDLVTVADLDVATETDTAAGLVRVGGGARYGELCTAVHRRGRALHNLGSLPHISVAGACATGTHGGGDTNAGLATAVRAIEFVRADGELIRLTDADRDFGGAVLSLGALGIVTALELATEPAYDIRQDVWLDTPLDTAVERLPEILGSAYSVSLFTSLRRDVVDAAWVKSRPDLAGAPDGSRWGARRATHAVHPIVGQDAGSTTQQLGVPGPWHERLPHFRLGYTPSNGREQQSEWLVPREHGAAALEAVRGIDFGPVLQVAEIRSIAADELWLSPCRGRARVGLHFTWVDDDRLVGRAVAAVEDALSPYDPRPHWGKVFTRVPIETSSRLADFRRLAARHDPGRKFGNEFLQRWVY